jgi:hypothetical protein
MSNGDGPITNQNKYDVQPYLDRIEAAKKAVDEAHDNLTYFVERIAGKCQDDKQMAVDAINELYWNWDAIKITTITKAFGITLPALNNKYLRPFVVGFSCGDCGASFGRLANDRKHRDYLIECSASGKIWEDEKWKKVVCDECYEVYMKKWEEERKAEEERKRQHEEWLKSEAYKQQRIAELRAMPYTDYLQSPEWRERRLFHVQTVKNRCQLCNSPQGPLHVHHRTYERLGYEEFIDLLVLCRACHETFHDQLSLARGG